MISLLGTLFQQGFQNNLWHFFYFFSGMHKVFYLLRSLKPSDHPINCIKDIWWESQHIVFILTWNSTSGLYVSIVWGKRGKRGWKWTKHAKSWSKFILDDESKRFCLTYFKTKTKWSARKDRSKKDLDQMASENIPLLLRWMNDLHST